MEDVSTLAEQAGEISGRERRLQLSCGECRLRKLSCNRHLSCQRCKRAGRAHLCFYDENTTPLSVSEEGLDAQPLHEEIRRLRDEIDQLKASQPSNIVMELPIHTKPAENAPLPPQTMNLDIKPLEPRQSTTRGYYQQHTRFLFFTEIPQLFPFIKETTDEFLKPAGVNLKKNKSKEDNPLENLHRLQWLLPPTNDLDMLINHYTENLMKVLPIIHGPTFWKDYKKLRANRDGADQAFVALVLSILSLSVYAVGGWRFQAATWISKVDMWLQFQSLKKRRLVHYQIACLLQLAKRAHMIHRKSLWADTSALIHETILDGLNCDPSPKTNTPLMVEMKRRVWAVLREFDLQSALEHGLPTILHDLDPNVAPPANIDNGDLKKNAAPISLPADEYTDSSYLVWSARSWELRLEVSRRLHGRGNSAPLTYEEVLSYTHELTRAMDEIPSSTVSWMNDGHLTIALLQSQLRECILALHRPYLAKEDGRFSVSDNICYQTAQDIMDVIRSLYNDPLQTFSMLREDFLLTSLTILRLSLQKPGHSDSISPLTSDESRDMKHLERGLRWTYQRYRHCVHGEPWCLITMLAAVELLKVHTGQEDVQAAKQACGQEFLRLRTKGFEPTPATTKDNVSDWLDTEVTHLVDEHWADTELGRSMLL